MISYCLPTRQHGLKGPSTPELQRLAAITQSRFSLFRFRSPLLSESLLFSLPVGTEMFHFPTFPPAALYIQAEVTGHDSCRVSPFGNPWIKARLSAPQGFSQTPTSFIGFWCQGIHRVPLVTCIKKLKLDARVHCAVLKLRAGVQIVATAYPIYEQFHSLTWPRPKRPTALGAFGRRSRRNRLPVPSGPNSVSSHRTNHSSSTPQGVVLAR